MSVNISIIVLKKMYDILMIFVEIFHDFGRFFATRIRFMKRIRLTKMKRIRIRNTGWETGFILKANPAARWPQLDNPQGCLRAKNDLFDNQFLFKKKGLIASSRTTFLMDFFPWRGCF